MRFPKTFSALAVLIGLAQAAGAQTCTPKVPASSLIEAPKWQMSINPTLPPQQFVDDKGELQGLNVELAREIAKRICADCPVKEPCLEYALEQRIDHGVWGGTSERQRRRILKKRKVSLPALV